MLTAQTVRELLHYDPETGIFRWRRNVGRHGRIPAGTIAGNLDISKGYWTICINCHKYRLHCLAWLYETGSWPTPEIDHRDGDTTNNKLDNLRLATRTQQCINQRKKSNNTSGFKGVGACKNRWKASFRNEYLGLFKTREQAHAAYMAAAKKDFVDFARAE